MDESFDWLRGRGASRKSRGTAALATAAGLFGLLSACVEPDPRSLEPSTTVSTSVSMVESPSAMVEPVAADVTIVVGDLSMSYATEICPVARWLDPEIDDGISFGSYPELVTASDGARWSTFMLVLKVVDGVPMEWSFTLTTPLSGIPGDPERRLISRREAGGDEEMEAAITEGAATFTTSFWDSVDPSPFPSPVPGTVTVTCD